MAGLQVVSSDSLNHSCLVVLVTFSVLPSTLVIISTLSLIITVLPLTDKGSISGITLIQPCCIDSMLVKKHHSGGNLICKGEQYQYPLGKVTDWHI